MNRTLVLENLQSTDVTLLKYCIGNLETHQLGRALDPPFIGLFSFRHAVDNQLYRIEICSHVVEVQAWEQELLLTY